MCASHLNSLVQGGKSGGASGPRSTKTTAVDSPCDGVKQRSMAAGVRPKTSTLVRAGAAFGKAVGARARATQKRRGLKSKGFAHSGATKRSKGAKGEALVRGRGRVCGYRAWG